MLICGEVFTDNELDLLYENIALGKPDSNHDKSSSQVRLFVAVRSSTVELLGRVRLVLAKGSNREKPPKEAVARDCPHLYLNLKSSDARLCF